MFDRRVVPVANLRQARNARPHRQAAANRQNGQPKYRNMFVVYWPPLRSYLGADDMILWTKWEPRAEHFHTRTAARKTCKRLGVNREVEIRPRRVRV